MKGGDGWANEIHSRQKNKIGLGKHPMGKENKMVWATMARDMYIHIYIIHYTYI